MVQRAQIHFLQRSALCLLCWNSSKRASLSILRCLEAGGQSPNLRASSYGDTRRTKQVSTLWYEEQSSWWSYSVGYATDSPECAYDPSQGRCNFRTMQCADISRKCSRNSERKPKYSASRQIGPRVTQVANATVSITSFIRHFLSADGVDIYSGVIWTT